MWRNPTLLFWTLLMTAALAGCADGGASGTQEADAGQRGPDLGANNGEELDMAPGADMSANNGDAPDLAPQDMGDPEDLGADVAQDLPEDPDQGQDMGIDLPQEDMGGDPGLCTLGQLQDADRDRVVLVSHPFGQAIGEAGTTLRTMTLSEQGELFDNGIRFDVGFRVERMAFVPSGDIALILGEDGELASVAVRSAQDLEILDVVQLPSASFGDLHITPEGDRAFVVGSNVAETSGISTVQIDCSPQGRGQLTVLEEAFFNLRLTQTMALLPGKLEAVLLGGQAVFEPIDDDDIRLLRFQGDRWVQVASFDIFQDFVTTSRLGVSFDGQQVLVPNSSPFSTEGGQVLVLDVNGEQITETQRLMALPDGQEVRYLPDNQTALLTQAEPGRVRVLQRDGDQVRLRDESFQAGLCEQMASVERGALLGTVLVPAISPAGPIEVVMLRLVEPGQVEQVARVSLGQETEDIPHAVAVSP